MLTPSLNVAQSAFPRTCRGDLGAVAQRLQPGLVAWHRHRRDHLGVRPGIEEPILCAGDALAVIELIGMGPRCWSRPTRATAGRTPAPGRASPEGHRPWDVVSVPLVTEHNAQGGRHD